MSIARLLASEFVEFEVESWFDEWRVFEFCSLNSQECNSKIDSQPRLDLLHSRGHRVKKYRHRYNRHEPVTAGPSSLQKYSHLALLFQFKAPSLNFIGLLKAHTLQWLLWAFINPEVAQREYCFGQYLIKYRALVQHTPFYLHEKSSLKLPQFRPRWWLIETICQRPLDLSLQGNLRPVIRN